MPWTIDPRTLPEALGIVQHLILNDFCAIGHAAATLGSIAFPAHCRARYSTPEKRSDQHRRPRNRSWGGPGDPRGWPLSGDRAAKAGTWIFRRTTMLDDRLMAALRRRYSHVSAERVVSGPALMDIYAVIAGAVPPYADDRESMARRRLTVAILSQPHRSSVFACVLARSREILRSRMGPTLWSWPAASGCGYANICRPRGLHKVWPPRANTDRSWSNCR